VAEPAFGAAPGVPGAAGARAASSRRFSGGKLLIFLPFLTNFFTLFRRQLFQRFVLFARGLPLRRCELRPRMHLGLHPLLLGGTHRRIPLGDAQPLLAPLRVELVPFAGQRQEDLPVGGVTDRCTDAPGSGRVGFRVQ